MFNFTNDWERKKEKKKERKFIYHLLTTYTVIEMTAGKYYLYS